MLPPRNATKYLQHLILRKLGHGDYLPFSGRLSPENGFDIIVGQTLNSKLRFRNFKGLPPK